MFISGGEFNMKKIIFLFCICFFNAGVVPAGNAPKSIALFSLGDTLSKHEDKIVKGSTMCIRYQSYLSEVEVLDVPGYKVGLITYGNCADPGKIVRIKLKYKDFSKKFYERLFKRYKIKFGEPHEWKGDVFGVVHAWKWSFADEQGNKISLTLQHNSEDRETKMGNSVKLTMTSAIEKEKVCYESKKQGELKGDPDLTKKHLQGPPDWDMLIPR